MRNTEYSNRFTEPERAPTIRSVPLMVLAAVAPLEVAGPERLVVRRRQAQRDVRDHEHDRGRPAEQPLRDRQIGALDQAVRSGKALYAGTVSLPDALARATL